MIRLLRWGLLPLLGLALGLVVPSVPAQAAGLIVGSDPIAHAELNSPPGWVTIAFRREVDAGVARIVVTNSSGDNVAVNDLIVEGTNVTTQLKSRLPKGTYTVHYRVDRPDGEVEGGAFQFAYGKGHWKTPADAHWTGNKKQPTVVEVPPAANESPSETPTPTPTPTPTMTEPTAGGTSATEVPSATPSAAPSSPGWENWGWSVLGVVAIALGAGVTILLIRRQRPSA